MNKSKKYGIPTAHYIGFDGRVVAFDAEVKEDGSVRPLHYNDFMSSDETKSCVPQNKSPENYPPEAPHKTSNNSTSIPQPTSHARKKDDIIITPKAQLLNAIAEKNIKEKYPLIFKKNPEEGKRCFDDIVNYLSASSLSSVAKEYIYQVIKTYFPNIPNIGKGTKRKFRELGIINELNEIQKFYEFCNEAITNSINNCINQSNPNELHNADNKQQTTTSQYPFSFLDYPIEKEICREKIEKILNDYPLSSIVRSFINQYIIKLKPVNIQKLVLTRKVRKEKETVLIFFKIYNNIIEEEIKLIYQKRNALRLKSLPDRSGGNSVIYDEEEIIKEVDFKANYFIQKMDLPEKAETYLRSIIKNHKKVDLEKVQQEITIEGLQKAKFAILSLLTFYNEILAKVPSFILKDHNPTKDMAQITPNRPVVQTKREHHSEDNAHFTSAPSPTTVSNFVRKGPLPVYGYARDFFGRVQEQDSYREDIPINPYSTNSDFDPEDDGENQDIVD